MRARSVLPLLLSALTTLALPAAAQVLSHEKHVLDNGLTVILHEDHALPTVVVNLWYGVGAKDEDPGRSGFAHLFEHLMFMGTERVPGSQFDQLMEAAGGWNNASTSFDRTNYYSTGPSSLLPTLLWLEADRLEDLGRMMTQEKLDLQREVVRNERRQTGENQPYGKADMLLTEELFPLGHPYHVSVIGTHEDLEAATLEDVTSFFDTFYLPSNCSLVVAGDFEPQATLALIRRLFDSLPSRRVPPKASAPPVQLERSKTVTLFDAVEHARTTIAFHSPVLQQPGDAEMDLIAGLLAGGKSSRLNRRLVRDERAALEVVAYQWSLRLGSVFIVQATAAPEVSLERVETLIGEELERLRTEGPTEAELERARNDIEHSNLKSLESLQNRADRLNAYQNIFGEPDGLELDLDRYRSATTRDLRSWARKVLDRDRALTLRVLSENPRDERPEGAPAKAFELPMPTSFELSNGLLVHHWQRGELPLLSLRLHLPSGASLDLPEEAGLTAATLDMLDEGTAAHPGAAFAEALEQISAELGTEPGHESSVLSLRALERTAPEALRLFAEALTTPAFADEDWSRVREQTAARLDARADDAAAVGALVSQKLLFGGSHPLSRPLSGDPASLRRLETADLKRRHASLARREGALLFTAGRLDAAAMKALLDPVLSGWTSAGEAGRVAVLPEPAPRQGGLAVFLVDRPGAVQTVIRYAWPAEPATGADRLGLEMVHQIFGGSFTSRLNANLREEHGYTYGARSGLVQQGSAGWMIASSSVRTDVTGASLGEFAREFALLRTEGLSPADVDKASAGVRSGLVDGTEGLDGILETALSRHAKGLPLASLDEDLGALAGWSSERLSALAASDFGPETGVLVLVGDKGAILPQLEGLGLKAPVEVDAEGLPLP